jgi:hypothetical protein
MLLGNQTHRQGKVPQSWLATPAWLQPNVQLAQAVYGALTVDPKTEDLWGGERKSNAITFSEALQHTLTRN